MKRRQFLNRVFGTAAAGVWLGRQASSTPSRAVRPHILLIHTDEHRIDCLGAYGNKQIQTPNIDALASNGVLFLNSFCSYPVCTPSRYSLLTGRYVREHGGYSNHCTLKPEVETLPALLKASGYKTKAIGKMHFTPTYLDIGFEEMELAEQAGPGRYDDDYHRYLRDRDLVDYNDLEDQVSTYRKQAPESYLSSCGSRASNLPEEHHSTTWIGDRAVETIAQWSETGANFLMVGFIKPHHPFDPPKPWVEMYEPEKTDILPGWTDECFPHDQKKSKGYFPHVQLTKNTLKQITAYYYAGISQIDHHVGRMIQQLKEKNLYDKTLILFTSDHGDYMGFHHMLLKGNYLYDPLAKVPLIIKYPKNRDGGTVSRALVSNIDLAPTILKVSGLTPPGSMKGLDLSNGRNSRKVIIAENDRRTVMARTQSMKLIVRPDDKDSSDGLLFDLEKDPYELQNLFEASDYAEERSHLLSAIHSWLSSTSPQELYLDEKAPQIRQPNVPPLDMSHRKGMEEYFKKKMESISS